MALEPEAELATNEQKVSYGFGLQFGHQLRKNRFDGMDIEASRIEAASLAGLLDRIADDTISGKIAKEVFEAMWAGEGSADEVIERRGLRQITDAGALEAMSDGLLEANPSQVEQYSAGRTKLLGFFVGAVMKQTGGKANPKQVNELLRKRLDS